MAFRFGMVVRARSDDYPYMRGHDSWHSLGKHHQGLTFDDEMVQRWIDNDQVYVVELSRKDWNPDAGHGEQDRESYTDTQDRSSYDVASRVQVNLLFADGSAYTVTVDDWDTALEHVRDFARGDDPGVAVIRTVER